MEVDDIQTPQQARKFSRVTSNGTTTVEQPSLATTSSELVALSSNRLRQWPHSSRIIRVSRASGGKDRHSKVWTARGPRDRRVRLSVNTAIQFYDLQDRLGYEQPSKAVEWLIKAADDAINELPSLDRCLTFPSESPRQLSVDRQGESPDPNLDLGPQNQQQMSRSGGCNSNNSENSKGSGGLSLSRSEIRVKARERARERTAKEKVRDDEPTTNVVVQGQQLNIGSNQTSSFTQLLTAGISNRTVRGSGATTNHWLSPPSTTAMDYFGNSIHSHSESHSMSIHDHHSQLLSHHQHFPFLSDHHQQQQQNLIHQVPVTSGGGGNIYNFNFSISPSSTTSTSGLVAAAGFNSRGTLQSNSPSSLLPYLQRFNSNNTTTDGSNSTNVSVPFFLGGAAVSSTEETHHHQFQPPGLQLCYGDAPRQGDHHKGKSKNNN